MFDADKLNTQMRFREYRHGERVAGLSGLQHKAVLKMEKLSRGEKIRRENGGAKFDSDHPEEWFR